MARLVFPDDRDVSYRGSGAGAPLLSAAGQTATVYADAAGTVLADIVTQPGGAAIAGSVLTVDATSLLPLFQGPNDGSDTLYVKVGTGPVTPIYARADDRIDANTAALAAKVDSAGAGLVKTGTTLAADFGAAAGKVTQGNDSRLSDARIPAAHHATHEPGGADALTNLPYVPKTGAGKSLTVAANNESLDITATADKATLRIFRYNNANGAPWATGAVFNSQGAFGTNAWVVISGSMPGTPDAEGVYFPQQALAADNPMLSVWGDINGPALQLRSLDGQNATRPLDVLDPGATKHVFSILDTGALRWGAGTFAGQDVSLARSAAKVLTLTGGLVLASNGGTQGTLTVGDASSTEPAKIILFPQAGHSSQIDWTQAGTVHWSWYDAGGNDLYLRDQINGIQAVRVTASTGVNGWFVLGGVLFPVQAATASAPSYNKGGIYFDTTLNKLRVGGATAWETVTSA